MFNKGSFIRLIYSLFVATVITAFTLVFSSDFHEAGIYIFKGMAAGGVIWLLGELLFTLCERLFPSSTLPGYIVLSLLIALGTAGFGYIMGISDIVLLIAISLAAEACGIGIAVFYQRKYYRELNDRLEKSKKELE